MVAWFRDESCCGLPDVQVTRPSVSLSSRSARLEDALVAGKASARQGTRATCILSRALRVERELLSFENLMLLVRSEEILGCQGPGTVLPM